MAAQPNFVSTQNTSSSGLSVPPAPAKESTLQSLTTSTPESTQLAEKLAQEQAQEVRAGKRLVHLGSEPSAALSQSMQKDLVEAAKQMNIQLELEPDGSVGVNAVKQFQREFKLQNPNATWASQEDGIIGPRTIRALDMTLGRTDKLLSDAEFGKALDQASELYVSSGQGLMDMIDAFKKVDLKNADLGFVSALFESGEKGGPGTISTGAGDFGGKSYGTHQLASRTGSLQNFLKVSGYENQFSDPVGSAGFDNKWRELAKSDPAFGEAQHKFIVATHYQPQVDKLAAKGIDLSQHGRAVQEAIFSTATQYGPNSSIIGKALEGSAVSQMSDLAVVNTIQDYKASRVGTHFKSSSPQVQASVQGRIRREQEVLQALT